MTAQLIPFVAIAISLLQKHIRNRTWNPRSATTLATLHCSNTIKSSDRLKIVSGAGTPPIATTSRCLDPGAERVSREWRYGRLIVLQSLLSRGASMPVPGASTSNPRQGDACYTQCAGHCVIQSECHFSLSKPCESKLNCCS